MFIYSHLAKCLVYKSWTRSALLKGISQCLLVSSTTCRSKEAIEWVWSFLCGKIEHKTTPITSSLLSHLAGSSLKLTSLAKLAVSIGRCQCKEPACGCGLVLSFTTNESLYLNHTHSIASLFLQVMELTQSTGWCLSAAQTLSNFYKPQTLLETKMIVNEQQSLDEL